MRPLQAQYNTSEGHQTFADAAEEWLLRPRKPHADEAVLDAVQRRQEPQEGAQHVQTTSARNGTHAPLSTTAACAVHLVKLQGEQQCETWLLPLDRPVLIGRSGKKTSSLDIDLWPDMSVSRRHALIWFDAEGWCIEDLHSTNGTMVDNSNIRAQHAMHLAPGTKIQFGRTSLILTTLAPESGESAQASADIP